MAAERTPKISLKEQAYHYIKERILRCEYEPGTFLNEQQLCDAMHGISRTPVRDALGRLDQEGLVTILPKKGVMVAELRLSDINRIYEVRQLLEPYALRNYHAFLKESELLEFRRHFCNDARPVLGTPEVHALDDRFHKMFIATIQNRYLVDTYANIQNQNRRVRMWTGDLAEHRVDETFIEHMAIVDACLVADWEKAAAAMSLHLENSRKLAFELLMENGKNL